MRFQITYLLVAAGECKSNDSSLSSVCRCPHRDRGCEAGAIVAWNGADGHWVRDEGEIEVLAWEGKLSGVYVVALYLYMDG